MCKALRAESHATRLSNQHLPEASVKWSVNQILNYMKVLVDSATSSLLGGSAALGEYAKQLNFAGGDTIRPKLRKGISVNSNEVVELCKDKGRLMRQLQKAAVPVPPFRSGEELISKGMLDLSKFEKAFDLNKQTIVHRSPASSTKLENHASLYALARREEDWLKSIFYEQDNDCMYGVNVLAGNATGVEIGGEKRDFIFDKQFANPLSKGLLNISQVEVLITEFVRSLGIDFIDVTVEFSGDEWYVTNATTGVNQHTLEVLKALLRRKVNQAK